MFRLSCVPRFPLALLASILAACGGGGDGGTTPTPIPAAFTVSLSSSTLSVEQGASGTVSATIGRTGGHIATIDLTIEGLPTGVTASFSPSAITASATSTTLSVTVAASVTPGPYPFTIRGTAGVDTKTGLVTLTVAAKPAVAITLSAATASVQQGAGSSYTATLARTNFTAAVTVAVTGAPTGVTPTVTNTGDVYTVSIAVGGNTAPGTYPLTTTVSGTGVASVSGTFTLTVTAAPPSILLAASTTAVSIQAGGAGQASTIAITRINFTGTVVTAVQSGLPTGATATVNPTGPTAGTSVTVTFAALVSTVPGTYNVVLQGAGFQANPGLVTIALTVTPPPTTIALSATPAALTVAQNTSGATTINIARTNFNGSVTLVATGEPAGVTPTFTPPTATGNSATLGFAVAASAAIGTYPITVTGSGPGISNAITTVNLTVSPVLSGSTVSYAFCPANGIPIWFAAQSGTGGPWVQVAVGANNTFTTTIAGLGGVAYVMQGGSGFFLTIAYGTAPELAASGASQCSSPTLARKSVSGTVTGFGTGNADLVQVSFGSAFASPQPTFALPNFSIFGALDGVRDLIGTRSTFNVGNPMNPFTVNKLFLKRGLNPANFGSVGTVDFNSVTDAFDPDTKQVTINGLVGGENQVGVFNNFSTANQSVGATLSSIFIASGNTATITTVPSARTIAGDVQNLYAFATTLTSPTVQEIRAVSSFFRDPSNLSITLGPQLNTPTVSAVVTAPYARMRTQVATQAQYLNQWTAAYAQTGRTATISMTGGYLGGAGTFDVTIPDFTGVGTWQATWGIQPAIATSWFASAVGFITGSGGLDDGTTYRIAQRSGQITP